MIQESGIVPGYVISRELWNARNHWRELLTCLCIFIQDGSSNVYSDDSDKLCENLFFR